MLELKDFASAIETALNQNTYGIHYAIFTDGGEYKNAFKSRFEKTPNNEIKACTAKTLFTNGMLRGGPSTITPTQGLTVATQSAQLEICAQLLHPETDQEVIEQNRAIIDGYFQQYRVDSVEEKDADGKVTKAYTVSALYSLAGTGDIAMRDGIGTSITFTISAEFAYIENGLNSNNCTFTLDGMPIPYTAAKITKSPVAQSDADSDTDGRGTTVNTSFVRSFDFQLPATSGDDGLGAVIMSEIMDDAFNTPHKLVANMDGKIKTYNVIFGQSDISLEGINNAGHNISLIESVLWLRTGVS